MTNKSNSAVGGTYVGPFVAAAIGDAYGAGFEFAPLEFVTANNTLEGYVQNPSDRFPMEPGKYTDDTQMATGVALAMLLDKPWNSHTLAGVWLQLFKQDPTRGYASGFEEFLKSCSSTEDFLSRIEPYSERNGAAMRAWPVGYLSDTREVITRSVVQASVTHATLGGITSAVATALVFHYMWHNVGPKQDVLAFLDEYLPNQGWWLPWNMPVPCNGMATVKAALAAFLAHDSLGEILKHAVSFTGDTDTVATIAMAWAAASEEVDQDDLPQALLSADLKLPLKLDEKMGVKYARKDS